MRIIWIARISHQSILKEINPEYSLDELMLQMKLQNLGHLMQILGKIEGKTRRGWQRIKSLDSISDSMDTNVSKLWEIMEDRETWCSAIHGVTESDTA